ncbi:daptide-type RiPP biosynthesis methyltransferase [Streptomyces sp. JJ38]|uniref:daptide-type RiPP biosynthesis methyltransferase n=1 Tax=Streptomyces sp. JJ38 TaxID=2738128 RepID=UPI001C583C56|nr:daptide-type RiPP biosynthesis methyltransferase [Streptomyces sp. JJ38]MBW1596583.1 class I SAM-dependent methyltransferase [Streptomyces sp. JJ38]
MTAPPLTLADVPGAAGEELAALGERARVCGVYDETGAPLYDDLSRRDSFEVRELLGLVRRTRGPVLELAAGTGRLTFPLLAAGREVTALELAPAMLERLVARLAEAPERMRRNCRPVPGDMSDFALGHRFAAVVLGTTSVSLLDAAGRAGLYRCVREHLAPGGTFALSTVEVADAGEDPTEVRQPLTGASGREYVLHELWEPGRGVRTVTLRPADVSGTGPVPVCVSRVTVLPVAALTAELTAAGFTVRGAQTLSAAGSRHHDVLLEATAATETTRATEAAEATEGPR